MCAHSARTEVLAVPDTMAVCCTGRVKTLFVEGLVIMSSLTTRASVAPSAEIQQKKKKRILGMFVHLF